MIIVDASVLANALTDDGLVGQISRAELTRDEHWAAPEHLLVETFSAIRGRWVGGKITLQRATDALGALDVSAIEMVETKRLLHRMWLLRANLSGDDAAYVAAAEANGCPLVTADLRLSRVPGLRCELRLAVPAGSG